MSLTRRAAPDDTALVMQARAGSLPAFEQLVQLHQSRVYRFVRRQVRSDADAEDLAQEAFLRAYRGIAEFRGDSRFSTWLMGIALNLVRDWLGRVAPTVSMDEEDAPEIVSAAADPSVHSERNAVLDALDAAIDRLPEELKGAFVLCALEGLGYEEACRVLEVPMGTVKSRINRARARLRESLDGHDLAVFRDDSGRPGE